jgi:hypothetical protein
MSLLSIQEGKAMEETRLMKGNEALAEAAIRAGCQGYFGYPITPQSEVLEYLAEEGRARGMVVLQAESELAAINMVYGAAGAGARAMTSSSSPGISLMQEGISYIASAAVRASGQYSPPRGITSRQHAEGVMGITGPLFLHRRAFRKWRTSCLTHSIWRTSTGIRR